MQTVSLDEAKKIITDEEALKVVREQKEPVFRIENEIKMEKNPLLEIEIAIRKVERLGGFKE